MTIRLHEDVSVARTEYGSILLDQASGQYCQLNRTATVIVDALGGGRTVEEAAAAVAERFEVDLETARRDVTALVGKLHATGLVVA